MRRCSEGRRSVDELLLHIHTRKGKAMKAFLVKFWKDEEGLTIVEYAVAGGLITAAAVTAFEVLGGTVTGIITQINTELQ